MYDVLQEQDINIAIRAFKGLDFKTPDELKGVGVAETCQNWRFDQNGHLSRRPTYSKYNATSLGANPITYLKRIYIGSNKYLICAYDTTLKVGSDIAGTFSNLKISLTAGQNFNGVTYKNFHYCGNGFDSNIKTNGLSANTDVMGCTAMSVISTIGLSATVPGCLLDSATYKYKFGWEYDSYQIANAAGFVSATAVVNVSAVKLYGFEAAPINASHMNIYRTEGGGSIYYHHSRHTIGSVSGFLSATPYVDIVADSSLDTTVTAPTDNGVPLSCKYFLLHKDRVFIAGNSNNKNLVYFSDITGIVSYPDIFPAGNYLSVAQDDGDEIMGLAHDPMGFLCVLKRNSIRKVFTDGDPSTWSISEPFTLHGCWASQTIKETSAGIIYLAKDGWRIFNGQSSNFISNSDKVSKVIKDEISLTKLANCVGHYHQGLCYLSYADRESGANYNNRLLIYDTLSDNFIRDTSKNINAFCTYDGSGDWGQLAYGDSVNGFVYNEEINIAGVIYNRLSDFRPNGTLSNLVVWNSEADPYLELGGHYTFDRLNGSSFSMFSAGCAISAWDMFPTNYSVSGTYTSPVIQTNSKAYYYAYWNELLGDYGNVTVAFRTSNTSAGLSGSYSSEYTNPGGSDISGLTAEDWLQFRITLSSTSLSATPRVYVQGGYAFKVTFSVQTTAVEGSMDCDWRSGYMQISPENVFCRARRFEVEHEGVGGQLSCIWDMDYNNASGIFGVDLTNNPRTYLSPFPTNAFGKKLRLRLHYDNINDLVIKAVNVLASPQPERY